MIQITPLNLSKAQWGWMHLMKKKPIAIIITPTAIWNSKADSLPNDFHQDQNFPTTTANRTINPAFKD